MNELEKLLNEINNKIFLSEFTFAKNKFKGLNEEQVEFADCVIWYGDKLILFQLKEREKSLIKDYEEEKKWFLNKVQDKAKDQIKDSIKYLSQDHPIEIENIRGHTFNVKAIDVKDVFKIIIYKHDKLTALNLMMVESQKAGFIHIIDYYDYLMICNVLDTPSEIFEYLGFREQLLKENNILIKYEKNILGAYLKYISYEEFKKEQKNKSFDLIVISFDEVVDNIILDKKTYDIGDILDKAGEKMCAQAPSTDYYEILSQLARMGRSERKLFKERWDKSIEDISKDESVQPYRIIIATSKCGVIFIPLKTSDYDKKEAILKSFTIASKYEQKIKMHIGISFCKKDSLVYIDWCYIESEWRQEPNIDKLLAENNPFRPLKANYIERHKFGD
jgi:hypothetical protein